jgi:DNA-binding MurR/RpiR family transcriptional regulator
MPTTAPVNVEQFLAAISAEFPTLSKQLKLIAQHVEAHQDHIGLEGIQDVATACSVQPSAVVRFAKHFGFSGFTEMQKIFRDVISQQIAPGRSYQARIRKVIEAGGGGLTSVAIAQEFLAGSVAGLQELQHDLDGIAFKRAVDLLAEADDIWLVASRRSYAAAVYLSYALQHTDKRIHLIHAMGSMHEGQARAIRKGDVVLAISYAPYAEETQTVALSAVAAGAQLISITDSRMSPLAKDAKALLLVQESAALGFRSLTSTMSLAQGLFIALAYRLELAYQPTSHNHRTRTSA